MHSLHQIFYIYWKKINKLYISHSSLCSLNEEAYSNKTHNPHQSWMFKVEKFILQLERGNDLFKNDSSKSME